jgi:hypothetical protein
MPEKKRCEDCRQNFAVNLMYSMYNASKKRQVFRCRLCHENSVRRSTRRSLTPPARLDNQFAVFPELDGRLGRRYDYLKQLGLEEEESE